MNRQLGTVLATIVFLMLGSGSGWAHCQIPCGIYDDGTRFTLMLEHVTTIEKSMAQITALGQKGKHDPNQVVRWVNNKESHADKLAEIITFYFMAQRVKPVSGEDSVAHAAYVQKVTSLHQMLVQTMKAKQTTDLARCTELRKLIAEFKNSYMPK